VRERFLPRAASVRTLALVALLPAWLDAQDPREILRRVIELDRRNTARSRNYKCQHRQEEQQLDHSGAVKTRLVRTWETTFIDGSPHRKLVARDDRPIPPEQQQIEEQQLRLTIEARRAEAPEQRARRIAEWERAWQKRREPLVEMPDAFDFKIAGTETLNRREAWVIDGSPKPGYRPQRSSAALFQRAKIRVWVDKLESQWARFQLETLDIVSFGGLLFRVAKGTQVLMEQARVDDEVWLPTRIELQVAGKLLLVKTYRRHYILTYSNYQKLPAETGN
jgi:hypothetical protein